MKITDIGEPVEFSIKRTGPNSVAFPRSVNIRADRLYRLTFGDRRDIIVQGTGVIEAYLERTRQAEAAQLQEVAINN